MRGTNIYAIFDVLADEYLGQLQAYRNDAAAVRFFGDVAGRQDTIVGQHPQDFELHSLGYIDDTNTLSPFNAGKIVVITGAAWLAAQQPVDNDIKLAREA